jgi:hypothetical protein
MTGQPDFRPKIIAETAGARLGVRGPDAERTVWLTLDDGHEGKGMSRMLNIGNPDRDDLAGLAVLMKSGAAGKYDAHRFWNALRLRFRDPSDVGGLVEALAPAQL